MRKIRNKIVLYGLALLLLGRGGTDIGQLRPVEVVQLYEKNGLLFLETDTEDMGWGLTIDEAVRKLKETTPGQIYLDTADYLLIEEGAEASIPALRPYLKRRTAMAYGPEGVDLQEAAAYLRVHQPTGIAGNGRDPVEKLVYEGGKMILKNIKKNENKC